MSGVEPPTTAQLAQIRALRKRDGNADHLPLPATKDEAVAEITKRRLDTYTILNRRSGKRQSPDQAEARRYQERVNAEHERLKREFYLRNSHYAPPGWTF